MPSATINQERLQQAAAVAEDVVHAGTHPSAVLAVANRDETVWTHVVSGQDTVNINSIFLLASITKPVLATAIMRLVEQGRLMLHFPVAGYLPEFAAFGKERVTSWHLLTHTSGLEEARWWDDLRTRNPRMPATLFEAACLSYLHFAPGTRCEYCSLSFDVLAALITRLTGQPYPEYLREQIFTPLGMRDTGFQPGDPARAVFVRDMGGLQEQQLFSALATGGGGLWGTVADLITFGQAFLRGGRHGDYRLLGQPAIEMMTRNQTAGMIELVDGHAEPFDYGLGWRKIRAGEVLGSDRSFGHGGATGTLLWVDPVWDLVFVFLTNRWGLETNTPRRVLNAVYGALDARAPGELAR
jgi:CubicO group peptidase (beta-lactamase class C family)